MKNRVQAVVWFPTGRIGALESLRAISAARIIQTERIESIDRIGTCVLAKITRAAREENRILGGPPSRFSVIVPCAKAHEIRIPIVHTAGEAERLEAWVCVIQHSPKLIEVHALGDNACGSVDD